MHIYRRSIFHIDMERSVRVEKEHLNKAFLSFRLREKGYFH